MSEANHLDESNWLRFRYHFLPPLVVAMMSTGEPVAVLTIPPIHLPMVVLATEFGPWVHPFNVFFSVFTFIATVIVELLKRTLVSRSRNLRIFQISLWWTYWGVLSLAMAGGTYRGP